MTIQKVIRLALSNEGYEIHAVTDGNDAVEQISVFRPDVVLIDVSLPGKTAFEVKRAINEHEDLEEVRFVLMSSAFEKVDEPQADEVHFHGRLTKPFDPAHLRQVLSDVLEQVAARRREPTSLLELPPGLPPLPGSPPTPPPIPSQFESPSAGSATDSAWMDQPILPEEPILAETPPEPVGQLWDSAPTGEIPLPPPLPELPRATQPQEPSQDSGPDADIRRLTESTIRMSGLDDFEWSVSEPTLKPPANLMDSGESDFGAIDLTPPREDLVSAASPSEYYRDSRVETPSPAAPPSLSSPPPPASAGLGTGAASLSRQQMEDLIRQELRDTFERMAEKILPEVAEKVIKQEIHRMLSES